MTSPDCLSGHSDTEAHCAVMNTSVENQPACRALDTAGRFLLWWPKHHSAPPPSSSAENRHKQINTCRFHLIITPFIVHSDETETHFHLRNMLDVSTVYQRVKGSASLPVGRDLRTSRFLPSLESLYSSATDTQTQLMS